MTREAKLMSGITLLIVPRIQYGGYFLLTSFFFSVLPPTATQPNGAVSLIYVGAVVLAVALVSFGIGLIKAV